MMFPSIWLQGLSDQAVNAFRVMISDGIKPSVLVLNLLINAFGEDRRDAEAFGVLQYMNENVNHWWFFFFVKDAFGFFEILVVEKILLILIYLGERTNERISWFPKCQEARCFLNLFHLVIFLFRIFNHIFNLGSILFLWVQGLKPDVVTYTTLMKALIRVQKFEKVAFLSLISFFLVNGNGFYHWI